MQIQDIYSRFKTCKRVSTDSRDIRKGDLFFALKGPNFDGNTYANDALEQGALYAVVDDDSLASNNRMLLVDDALTSLQELSAHHRRQFDIPVIAITGSNGKTTTKELTEKILSTTFETIATVGNLNNHIGVPLTLLTIDSNTEIAIIEMGANHVGEIAAYCPWADPTHGLITNIGKAHLEGFGGIAGVLKGKTELFDYIRTKKGVVMVNSNYPDLLKRSEGIKQITYGEAEGDDCRTKLISANPFVELELTLAGKAIPIKSNLIGAYNMENIAAAACIGNALGVDAASIVEAVENYIPKNNRSEFIKRGSNAILLDAYNANPSSMKKAIENLEEISAKYKVAILGDMLEMGASSYDEHSAIVGMLKDSNIDEVILVGKEFAAVKDQIACQHFEDAQQLKEWLSEHPIKNSHILIKGSRGIRLESAISEDAVSH